jgi:hypothetical protein
MNLLAETLARTGLAASATEASRMADSIIGTEKKVSKDFDNHAKQVEKTFDKPSYQEEIDELIKKTDPNKKDFHYMVSGYKRDESIETQKANDAMLQNSNSTNDQIKLNDVSNINILENSNREKEVRDQPAETQVSVVDQVLGLNDEVVHELDEMPVTNNIVEPSVQPVRVVVASPNPVINTPSLEKPTSTFTNQAVEQAIKVSKPVHTDNKIDDELTLRELMDEDAKEIYSNEGLEKPSVVESANVQSVSEPIQINEEPKPVQIDDSIEETPEYQIYGISNNVEQKDEVKVEASSFSEPETIIKPSFSQEQSEEFIVPKENLPEPEPVMKSVPEPVEEPKKVFKNPIEKINLMDHFKFG